MIGGICCYAIPLEISSLFRENAFVSFDIFRKILLGKHCYTHYPFFICKNKTPYRDGLLIKNKMLDEDYGYYFFCELIHSVSCFTFLFRRNKCIKKIIGKSFYKVLNEKFFYFWNNAQLRGENERRIAEKACSMINVLNVSDIVSFLRNCGLDYTGDVLDLLLNQMNWWLKDNPKPTILKKNCLDKRDEAEVAAVYCIFGHGFFIDEEEFETCLKMVIDKLVARFWESKDKVS